MSPFNFAIRRAADSSVQARLPLPSLKSLYRSTPKPHPPQVGEAHLSSRLVPWMLNLAYPLGCYGLLPFYFSSLSVTGQEHLPKQGGVILAPTHRSRWDALIVPWAAGFRVTGRHLRFMVTADEVVGLQGWFIRRMGGFPINTKHPSVASLRYGVELLEAGEAVVIFPEGNIYPERMPQPLKPGLARLALKVQSMHPGLDLKIVPLAINYSHPKVPWRTQVSVHIGAPLEVAAYQQDVPKVAAHHITQDLQVVLTQLVRQDDYSKVTHALPNSLS